ncbi:MAG: GNAT family N-acetyltransferase [Pseudomonadota bacterium]
MQIRPYTSADLGAVARLFTDAVHTLAASHYDAAQREAWAPQPPDLDYWQQRLAALHLLIAQDGSGHMLGFVGYEDNGHIDLLFTAPQAARRGVASQLYLASEVQLFEQGTTRLFTEASLLSRPVFERLGFEVVQEEQVSLRGAVFRRFAMAKHAMAG